MSPDLQIINYSIFEMKNCFCFDIFTLYFNLIKNNILIQLVFDYFLSIGL